MFVSSLLGTLSVQAQSYREIIRHIAETPAMQSAKLMERAAGEMASAAEGKNLPSIDLSVQGAWLKDTPEMILHFPMFPSQPLPMGKTRQFVGELRLSYPLFTGFAISAQIERSRLEAQRAKLKVQDLRRNLILNATQLYGAIEATEAALAAEREAKRATLSALKKAEGFYKHGLLPPADLYNIKAKVYDVEAAITQTESQKEQLLNQLSYLSGTTVHSIHGSIPLPDPSSRKRVKKLAYRYRSDIRVLQTLLRVDDAQIRLAESRYYPTVGVAAGLKRHGDTLALNGDGFTNADQSYLGVNVSWNLFNGGSDRHTVEAARYKKLSAASSLLDYRWRVATEIDNAFTELRALRSKFRSARMQVKAQEEYYKLTLGRFDNQLASADELSRSIADLARARARAAAIRSQIRVQRAKIWLLSGVKGFERKLGIAGR
ncbi:TolC family protein [Nitratifractor salsuginis]|uniref:TolC family protein n=1 Tax=Nitratifractor salsuginis TaxID=269261 RepID=UPI00145DF2CA|nr:TolC family protein [Nitratifractor salsuginis]